MSKPKIAIPEISFDSLPFKDSRTLMDQALRDVLNKVYNGEFEAGDITMKISLAIIDDYINLPGEDPLSGETTESTYEFRRPSFQTLVTTTLKKVAKGKTIYNPPLEIKENDGELTLYELPKAQMDIDDFDFDA